MKKTLSNLGWIIFGIIITSVFIHLHIGIPFLPLIWILCIAGIED